MAMINCKSCNAEISDKATSCPKCGAPVEKSDFFEQLPESVQSAIGIAIFIAIAWGIIWFFFFKSSVEITNQKVIYNLIFDRQISFTARNSGPATTYSYYVKAGDDFLDRMDSPKYCEGAFQIGKDQTKKITANCPDLNFKFTKYSIVVE